MFTKRQIPTDISPAAARRYVFVTGHPRSGTNWVSSLLNLHPHVFCDGEFHFLILRWAMDGYVSLPWYLGAAEPYRSIAERGMQQIFRDALAQRTIDKGKPQATVVGDHTPRIFRVMISPPEAVYVVLTRDGRDVLVSYTYHLVNTRAGDVVPDDMRPTFDAQLATLDGSREAISAAVRVLLSDEAWVRHFAGLWSEHVLHDRRIFRSVASQGLGQYVRFMTYERLRDDTLACQRELYELVGVDPAFAAQPSADTKTAPGFGGREDVTSFYRKGEAGDWLNHFRPELARWFHESAGDAMSELGYEPDSAWINRVRPSQSLHPPPLTAARLSPFT